ncbi:hypothetical protein LTS10_000588 [Elasticomyces elasticus]|nr:hypothetical protein LTS10_000588 [Elasticomyces elasticus]
MGTLTGNQTRLPGQCEHKLATSCRLSSIPNCCACADERAHTASYSTYVDGMGFVPWGKRWDRYCWYCKEFWEKRVGVSGIRPPQTRIPEVPDQREFLEKWEEFHRGYRIAVKEDGSEDRIAVLGEDWREVDPGCLPRTLEEMRAGRAASEPVVQRQQVELAEEPTDPGQTLEDTLDQMFHEAEDEDPTANFLRPSQPPNARNRREINELSDFLDSGRGAQPPNVPHSPRNVHAQAMVPALSRNREYQARRIAALRRELHRMRNGIERVISGLRDLGEAVPEHSEATDRLTALGSTLDEIGGVPSREQADLAIRSVNDLTNNAAASQSDRTIASVQARVDEARTHNDEARRNRDQAASELDVAEQEFRTSQQRLQQLQREQRTTENYLRLFGTREEMLAQGDQYESPIGGMFSRAYQRFNAAEEVRRDERTSRRVLEDEARGGGEEEVRALAEMERRESRRDVWGVPERAAREVLPDDVEGELEPAGELEEYYALLRRQNWSQRAPNEPLAVTHAGAVANNDNDPSVANALPQSTPPGPPGGEFPRSMLDSITASRRESTRRAVGAFREELHADPDDLNAMLLERARQEWRTDAHHILDFLASNEDYLRYTSLSSGEMSAMHDRLRDGSLSQQDRSLLNILFDIPEIVWGSRIMSARFQRSREFGATLEIRSDMQEMDRQGLFEQIELMAEAFQMSSQIRMAAPRVTAPGRLSMLYRLQAGERNMQDVDVLQQMLRHLPTVRRAESLHSGSASTIDHAQAASDQDALLRDRAQERRDAARIGDHSRQELDAQRRATRAFAIAAGRTAMQAGPDALLEQMANQDAETQAAYERLRANGWAPDGDLTAERELRRTVYRPFEAHTYISDSETEPEDVEDEAQGLDATDTGRPEPRSDEDMKVSLECRICYTQLAEIACLPCGHLVMCKWCSEQHSPVMAHDRTRPRRAAGCPLCRKGIRQKVRVFRA